MILSNDVAESIALFAREAYPYECCGALLGTGASITHVLPIANTTDEPKERRFRIRAEDFLRAEKLAEQQELKVLGFYHSHPNHPARPSDYDLEHAWPNLIYIILSVDLQRAGDLTAWLLRDDRSGFESVEIQRGETDANHNSDSHTAAALHE